MRPATTSLLPLNGIVLLEESDLYSYHDDGEHGLATLQDIHEELTSTSAMPRQDRMKSVRSIRNDQIHGDASSYRYARTPFAYAASDKRTASIDTIPAHYGALRPGGPVPLFRSESIGLLLNWIIIGFINGAISGLVYPLFENYLGFNATQQRATSALFDFGWYFKFLLGFVTDCVPIQRQRRKPYIFIGWIIVLGFMLALTFMHKVAWYGSEDYDDHTKDDIRNPDAPTQGQRYVLPILMSSLAHLLATVACEGLMVEYAHREGEYDRGRTQLWCVLARFLGEISGQCWVGFGLNSAEYGGTFEHPIPLAWFFAILALLAFAGIVVTHFFLHEDRVTGSRQSIGTNLRRFWRFIEQRATLRVMVALFLLSLAINISVNEYSSIYSYWLNSSTFAVNVMVTFQPMGYMVAAAAMYWWFLNTNWRVLSLGGFLIALLITLPIELLTIWNVVRSSSLFLSKDWIQMNFEAFPWLVRLIIAVEASEPGLESTTYGFLTTVCNLSNLVLVSAYNIAATTWDDDSTDLQADKPAVRWHLTYEFLFKYGIRMVFTVIACVLLPRQKRHLKEIKIRGAPNLIIPVVLFVIVALLFAAAMTSAFLSMFASTMCLRFAGGDGCGKSSDDASQ